MAIWQYAFNIIPRDTAIMGNAKTEREDVIFWNGYSVSEDSILKISKSLKPEKSWSDHIKQYGVLDKTCIEFSFEDGVLEEVSVRIDLRNITSELVNEIIDFIRSNDAIILSNEGALFEPSKKEIITMIKSSEACKFVVNPREFLSNL